MDFKLGESYTRKYISEKLGGGIQTYFPTKGGKVTCGCFRTDMNPGVPEIILVGRKPKVIEAAKIFCSQYYPVPFFIKLDSNAWEYIGKHQVQSWSEKSEVIDRHNRTELRKGGKRIVTKVIFIQKINDNYTKNKLFKSIPLLGAISSSLNIAIKQKPLLVDIIEIEEGQAGISYEILFKRYLENTKNVSVIDPHIKLLYQVNNFVEFSELLKPKNNNIKLTLETSSEDREQEMEQTARFEKLVDEFSKRSIDFSYSFNKYLHDRQIVTDSGYIIYLGRGLDIFHRPFSDNSFDNENQQLRKCKQNTIIYVQLN